MGPIAAQLKVSPYSSPWLQVLVHWAHARPTAGRAQLDSHKKMKKRWGTLQGSQPAFRTIRVEGSYEKMQGLNPEHLERGVNTLTT